MNDKPRHVETGEEAAQDGRLLRRRDQATVAVLTGIALALIAGSWIYRGGLGDRLIDIEHADPQTISFQLDMNSAEWAEWTVLPGIGEVLAQRIVESRDADGPFRDHADLLRVRGIGPRTLARIEPYLMPMPKADAVAGP